METNESNLFVRATLTAEPIRAYRASWQLDDMARWCSRALLMCALIVSTWCLAGYYPTGRFITLALLTLSFGISLFDRRLYESRFKQIPLVIVIGCVAIAYGAFQLTPLGNLATLIAPGLSETRADFVSALPTTTHDNAPEHSIAAPSSVSSHCLSISRWETKTAVSTLVIALVGLTLGWVLFCDDPSRRLLLIGLSLSGASQVFWGIIQQVSYPDQILWGYANPGHSTPFGSFLNRNHAADLLGMSLGCSIGLVVWCYAGRRSVRKYGERTLSAAWLTHPSVLAVSLLLGWLSIGLLSTLSRGGWFSAIVAIISVGLVSLRRSVWPDKRQKRRAWKLDSRTLLVLATLSSVFIGLLVVSLMYSGLSQRIGNRMHDLDVTSMKSDARWEHWMQALSAAAHYLPFGSGMGTYGYAHLPFTASTEGTWYSHAHNQYLEILVETGLPGIVILLAIFLAVAHSMRGVFRRERTPGERAMGYAALIAIVMQSLHAIIDFGLAMPANLLALSTMVGAGLAAAGPQAMKLDRRVSIGTTMDRVFSRLFASKWFETVATFRHSFGVVAIGLFIAPALIHLGHCVVVERMLEQTEFSDLTPAPGVDEAQHNIERLSQLVVRFPDVQQPRLRRARLRLHLVRRAAYEQLKHLTQERNNVRWDSRELWQRAALENAIFIIHNKRAGDPSNEASELESLLAHDRQLNLAWQELLELTEINPMREKTHLLLAKIAASTGREWRSHFQRAVELSSGDPESSFAIGLLALTVGDDETMLRQWRQTIDFDPHMAGTIVQVARQNILDKDVANRLLPQKWDIPYRLSLQTKDNEADQHFRKLLLRRAEQLILESDLDEIDRLRALFQVSNEMADYPAAAEWMLKAVQLEPHDPNLRYHAANALVKSERLNEAKSQIRVGTGLAPHEQRFKQLLTKLQRRAN